MRRSGVVQTALLLQLLVLGGCSSDPIAPAPPPDPGPVPGPGPGPVPDPLPDPSGNAGLWAVSAASPTVLRLSPEQLRASGEVQPSIKVYASNVELTEPLGVAFDAAGTLWVASHSDSVLAGFRPDAVARSGAADASIVIHSARGSLSGPAGLAFDHSRRLWVANAENGTLVRYDAAQLTGSGAPVPAVVISGLGQPDGLAFDASGRLWVSDAPRRTISAYTPAQLAASGQPVPAIVLSSINGSLANPRGIAFDAQGNLWVANSGARTVVAYARTQLGSSGAPAPRVVIARTDRSLDAPVGLAFDDEGNLWVMNQDGLLEQLAAGTLGASGSAAPAVRLQLTDYTLLWGIAFWPVPEALPLD